VVTIDASGDTDLAELSKLALSNVETAFLSLDSEMVTR